MTVNEIIEKARTKKHSEIDVYTIADNLGLDSFNLENTPVISPITQCYYIQWYCTDSVVGYSVLFFNNVPVALTSQLGRKCDFNIYWLDDDCYFFVYNYIKSLMKEEYNYEVVYKKEREVDIGNTYHVEFSNQLLTHSRLFYKNEEVQFVRNGNPKDIIDQTVVIKLSDGSEKTIDVSELMIEYFNKE